MTPQDAEQFEAARPVEPAVGVSAARGVGLLVARTLLLQLLTAGVTIVLARLLTPADYGLFALALAVQLVGQQAVELGLPLVLIRQSEDPTKRQQAAVSGVILATSTLLSALLVLAAFVLVPALGGSSKALRVVAVASLAMPFYAGRAMPMVLLERRLSFGRVAAIETADTLGFNCFALTAAFAGLGAFSLAAAVPAGALASVTTAWALQPFARRPTFDLETIRPMVKFGIQATAIQGVNLLRELGFVSLLTAVGGAPTAGFYAMAKRLFSFPIALTSAVLRVSLPALSRDASRRPRRTARAVVYTAIAASLPLALVAGAVQPLIHIVLGDNWLPTADIILVGSLGMMLAASANATMVGYALAEGTPASATSAAIAEAAIAWLLAVFLTVPLGEAGVGLAITASILGATLALAVNAHPLVRRSLAAVAKTALIAAIAAGAGQLVGAGNDLESLVVSLTVTTAVWLALEAALAHSEMTQLTRIIRPLLRKAAPT